MSFTNIKYCDSFKFLLVEEIALRRHPIHQHNGTCKVIGIINILKGTYFIDSLSFKNANIELPNGFCHVMLDINLVDILQIRSSDIVEVRGELRLAEKNKKIDRQFDMATSGALVRQLELIQYSLEQRLKTSSEDPVIKSRLKRHLSWMKKSLVPIIKVYSVTKCPRAKECIVENLKLRNSRRWTAHHQ